MQLYTENENYKLYHGNMLDMLDVIEPNTIDSVVTDPPYELNFMSKGWDNAGVSFQKETWQKCYEVLKPGGYLLAFGGSRTFHRIACAIEDAGFEIRDTIMWIYGSGFPKSQNISKMLDKKFGKERPIIGYTDNAGIAKNAKPDSTGSHIWSGNIRSDEPITDLAKQWQGWGTALKPSFEPIIVARKPFKGSLVDNVIENGVGGINIDECRIEHNEPLKTTNRKGIQKYGDFNWNYDTTKNHIASASPNGRFPANTILTYDETDYDEVCGGFPNTKGGSYRKVARKRTGFKISGSENNIQEANSPDNYGDSGSASRYFYCAKASKRDRDEGIDTLDMFEAPFKERLTAQCKICGNKGLKKGSGKQLTCGHDEIEYVKTQYKARGNIHPTVKPTSLMQYLVRLVTPNGGTILDPFNGSGSTGKAVMYENHDRNKDYKYIGIELTEEYLPIAKARIDYVINNEEKIWKN